MKIIPKKIVINQQIAITIKKTAVVGVGVITLHYLSINRKDEDTIEKDAQAVIVLA